MHHDHFVQIKIGHNEDHNDHNDDPNDDHNDDHLVQIKVGHNDAVEGEGESHQACWQLKAYKSPQDLTMMTIIMTMVIMINSTLVVVLTIT